MKDPKMEKKAIEKLSENLKEDLIYETYGEIFENISFF